MTGFFHALNVSTLATWMSLSGFGCVGIAIVGELSQPVTRELETLGPEIFELAPDLGIPLGGEESRDGDEDLPVDEETFTENQEFASEDAPVPEEVMEAPPELAELSQDMPLPELPAIPEVKPEPRPETVQSRPQTARRPQATTQQNTNRSGRSGGTGTASHGSGSGGGTGNAAGMSQGQRLAGGHRPRPHYPAASRRAGHQGSVVISLTIGGTGHVTAARIVRPCQYPELNEAALNSVRRWKFKPGPTVTTTQTITFRLR